jgi:tetratricopeptide (TPR) repeat protein
MIFLPDKLKTKILTKHFLRGLACLVLLSLFQGCSTQRNTWVNRNFHALNARYNGYFNARENFRLGMKRLSELHQDFYDQPLNIFRYGTDDQRLQISEYMEAAYQKSSLVIRRHSMLIRGTEHNVMIDDAYHLIALSHFFRGDIHLANFTFEYIYRQYDTPISYDAVVWTAKGHLREARFDAAVSALDLAGNYLQQGLLSPDGRLLYYLTFADLLARQGFYDRAAPHLIQAIDNTRNRRDKARLTFILGQYYQFSGNLALAQQTFAQILDMSPGFELALQARISMALTHDGQAGNEAFIQTELDRMIRDNRNEPFFDRLYYAKGQLAWRANRTETAKEYYRQSIRYGQDNPLQKGLSYLRLGEIFFALDKYLESSMFYDSAVVFLPAGYGNIDELRRRQTTLADLAESIRITQLEDSLQMLAAMDQRAREAIVDRIISDKREREMRQEAAQLDQQQGVFAPDMARRQVGEQDGGWYFYNPAAINFGRAEFASRFGNRPLEDMWRLSNRQALAPGIAPPEPIRTETQPIAEGIDAERQSYLQNIPATPQQIVESNHRMATAFFNKGVIFKDQLNDAENAISAFETLINRFPQFDNRLQAFTLLMNLWRELGNNARTEMLKGQIISEFPDSPLARALIDPDFLEGYRQRHDLSQQLYKNTYLAFQAGNHSQVLANVRAADTLELDRNLRSQFTYLMALSFGRNGMQDEFRSLLQHVVDSFPETPVFQPASHLLATLNNRGVGAEQAGRQNLQPAVPTPEELPSQFTYNPNLVHFFTIVVDIRSVDIMALRTLIAQFNTENFADQALTISNIFLDEERQLLTVTRFADKNSGMEYFRRLTGWSEMQRFSQGEVLPFIISVENYPIFYRDRLVEIYYRFFRIMYLN